MNNAEDKQDADTQPFEPVLSDELKVLGFDPGIPVYEVESVEFDLDDVRKALFESTCSSPITLPLVIGSRNPTDILPAVELHMVVELVQGFHPPYMPYLSMKKPIGCNNTPEWYIRGFLCKSGFDPYPEVIRMHVYIETGGDPDEFNLALVQLVREPSGADPSSLLKFGDGIPAQD